ncbi:FG-GAP-like repeat-containing protein, partial [Pelagibius sp. Alg239-R121]|uniref:FG-GAP-like repeat-containing protein n=1 Tax=Pelagibius sp. Alg239-R121 TaxID=2993448 RepID=UPI0024A7030B
MSSVSRLLSFGSKSAAGQRGLLFSAVAAASLLIGGASASAQTTVAGVTPGAIAVDESGSANYSIPLSVPPGVAGMAPSLSLIYGSRGDNGILGVGWSLGGLSVIHRCGKTTAQDDVISGVDYSANDRFCLDGQRLVATDGTYGADGTVYSTELASFSKIVSYGTAGNGPAHFKVWTKSGQIMTYGDTADSAVEVPGQSDVRYWSVNRIEDRVGNYLDLVYAEDTTATSTTENTHKITRINYAGNTVAGTLPTASVRFVYEPRTDTRVHFMAGAKTQTLERLKAIETYATFGAVDTLVKRYDMAYEYGLATGRSRLTSLTECDANGNCLEPHSFTYNGNPTGYVWSSQPSRAAPYVFSDLYSNVVYGNLSDVNGDGQIDMVVGTRRNNGAVVTSTRVSTTTGWATEPGYNLPSSGIIREFKNGRNEVWGELVDVNGDGLKDWVRAHRTNGVNYKLTYLNTGSGWVYTPAYNLPNPIENYTAKVRHGDFVDVNGDGLVDWVQAFRYNGANTQSTYLNTGSGWQYTPAYNLPGVISSSLYPGARYGEFVDVNGDGLPDWVKAFRHNGANQIATWLNTGSGWQLDTAYNLPTVYYHLSPALRTGQFIDVNGDGLQDFTQAYRYSSGTYYLHTWLSTGKGWEYSAAYNLPSVLENGFYKRTDAQFADLNSDGLPDFVVSFRSAAGGVAKIAYLNTGSGWKLDPNFEPPSVLYDKKRNVYQSQLGDVDGDGLVDWIRATRSASGVYTINTWVNALGTTDLMVSAEDGLGRVASITYKPLTDDSVYTKGSGATFPESDIQAPMYVVASVSQDDGQTAPPGGVEGQAVINYSYAGAKVNTQGRGFLGFRTVTARDAQTGILTTTTYNQTYPFTGQVDSSVTRLDNGLVVDLVKEVSSTYASKLIFDGSSTNQPSVLFPYADSSTSKAYEIARQDLQSNQVAGFLVSSTTTTSTYDDLGNALSITQSVTDETTGATAGQVFTTQTASLYDNDEVNWILGRVTSTTVTKSRPGAANQSRKSAWEYNATNGLLTKEIIEPDIAALKVTTSYTYDSFGNETAVTVSGTGVTSRSSTTSYDTNGQFPLSSANALSHSESMVTDARFGVVTSLTGPNGITTTWEYDGFGRKTKELRADGTESRITYELCGVGCQDGAVYKITSQDFLTAGNTALNTPSVQYYDKMNRVYRTESIAFDGVTKIYVDTSYNPRGESHMVSRPYFAGTAALDIKWATTHYDDLGRRMSVIAPDGGIQVFDYGGLTTTVNNALNQNMSKTQNAIGELMTSTDNLAGTVTYSYDAYGNLLQTNANGVLTTMTYDQRGRKTGMVDPDMGTWSYSYNVLGELISQTDAKLQVVTMAYDVLGRMTSRIETEGTTTWTYDSATKGTGKIHQVSGPNGYLEVASYDSLGRPDTTTTTISGTVYTTSLTYDAQGRPDTITYPSGFAVQNNYTANGFLGSVSEILGGTVYWQADTVDAEGMVTQETLGNGVVTNRAYDVATALLDSIQTTHNGTSIQNLSFVFDTLGNL